MVKVHGLRLELDHLLASGEITLLLGKSAGYALSRSTLHDVTNGIGIQALVLAQEKCNEIQFH